MGSVYSTREKKRDAYRILDRRLEEKVPLGRLDVDWRIILKWTSYLA